MFEVPVDESTKLICDSKRIVNNSLILALTLNKKHSSITYHSVWWNVAAGVIQVAWIDTNSNLADEMNNLLTA